jgi:glycosyltransferase involved in cell wall biosynthesis
VIVENEPEKMAAAVARLFESREEREALGRQARVTVEARFNWDTIAAAQAQMYRELLEP